MGLASIACAGLKHVDKSRQAESSTALTIESDIKTADQLSSIDDTVYTLDLGNSVVLATDGSGATLYIANKSNIDVQVPSGELCGVGSGSWAKGDDAKDFTVGLRPNAIARVRAYTTSC